MKIEIIEWETKGLRCPDMTINLEQEGKLAHVSLIQMPNGTAKTTTLTLIRACLNGEAKNWTEEKIQSFRRDDEYSNYEGQFTLKLRVDGKQWVFYLNFDFYNHKIEYETSSPFLGGITPGWDPPRSLHRFFDEKFVKLFIFDGEFAKDLLDSKKTHASEAIDNLFQLYLLDEVQSFVETDYENKTKNKASEQRGLTRQENVVKKIKERIAKVENKEKEEQEKLNNIQEKIEDLQNKIDEYDQNNKDLYDKKEEDGKKQVRAEEKVNTRMQEIMGEIRKPQSLNKSFIDDLLELKEKLDKAKLPENASRQFFVDLCEEENCICGRQLDEKTRQAIKERADLYLSDHTAIFLNGLKEDIRNNLSSNHYESVQQLTESLEELKTDINDRQRAKNKLEDIQSQLNDQGNDDRKKWQKELDDKKSKKGKLENNLDLIQRLPSFQDQNKKTENLWCLQALQNRLKEEEDKLAEISNTVELTEKKRILTKIIDQSLKKARENLQNSMIEECNLFLEMVLERDPLRIGKIDDSLHLENKKAGSEGQMLSVGYTFLTTLLDRINYDFPLFVDSPANSIDANIRRNIARKIPQLCHQFIALTISTEREGFTDTLFQNADSTKFITVFRQTEGTKRLQENLPREGVTKTKNAVLVEGKNYFDQFDLKNYEEKV